MTIHFKSYANNINLKFKNQIKVTKKIQKYCTNHLAQIPQRQAYTTIHAHGLPQKQQEPVNKIPQFNLKQRNFEFKITCFFL